MTGSGRIELEPIGVVTSTLVDRAAAPRQGDEGAPDAWLVLDDRFAEGLEGLTAGAQVIVVTWLNLARRDVMRTRPRDDPGRPEQGVFTTRSPDRPNPIGLHEVRVLTAGPGRPDGGRRRHTGPGPEAAPPEEGAPLTSIGGGGGRGSKSRK